MAEDWLKWTYGLAGKREVRVISSRLQRDRHEIAGRVMTLWEWLETNLSERDIDPESGDATLEMGENWKAQIDDIAGLPSFAEVLASADVCWVIPARSGGRVTFPRLGRHVGKLAKTRAIEARKKSRQRREKCPAPNGTKSGPEKEKEENINNTHTPRTKGPAWWPEGMTGFFRTKFLEWEEHCLAKGKPLTPATRQAQLVQCHRQGESRSLQVIDAMFERGWASFVWDYDQKGGTHGQHRPKTGSSLQQTTAGRSIREL